MREAHAPGQQPVNGAFPCASSVSVGPPWRANREAMSPSEVLHKMNMVTSLFPVDLGKSQVSGWLCPLLCDCGQSLALSGLLTHLGL